MIDGIFKLVEAPVHATGQTCPIFVDGVASPNWLPDAFSAHVASGVPVDPDTDRSSAGMHIPPTHNQANSENERRFKNAKLKLGSHRFAGNPMLARTSSPSRVRFAAQQRRALDRCGRARRSPGYQRIGSWAQ